LLAVGDVVAALPTVGGQRLPGSVNRRDILGFALQAIQPGLSGAASKGASFSYSGQLLLRMIWTKSSRTKESSKCCSTSAFTVPNVLSGRCFMPSLNGGDRLNSFGGETVTTDA
jgi:hypothetical protein